MSQKSTYFDYAASTPVDPRTLEAMLPHFEQAFGNPASSHVWGQQAEAAVETARHTVAAGLGADAEEIVFTSGGTESNNLALRGIAISARENRNANHLLISSVEHDGVSQTANQLRRVYGFEVEMVPVDGAGLVDPADLAESIRSDTALVSIIFGNNEIGSVNDIATLAKVSQDLGVPFHTDALQATSQLAFTVDELGVDLLSIGGHKFYGPKGVGALYVRRGTQLWPAQTGGGQERGQRAGTSNVPLIVGLAHAHDIAAAQRSGDAARFAMLRDRIITGVLGAIDGSHLAGHPKQRLPNHASFVFEDLDGNALLAALDLAGFACSSGSACKTGDPEPSAVLLALGYEPDLALGSLRVTVGRQTTQANVDAFVDALPDVIARQRAPALATA